MKPCGAAQRSHEGQRQVLPDLTAEMAGRPLSGPRSASDSILQGVLGKHRNWRCWRIATRPRALMSVSAGDLLQVIPSCTPAKTAYIEPGSPWENGYCESFNARFRDEFLNGEVFYCLREAQILIEEWRKHYNTKRPHSALGYKPPAPETIVQMDQRTVMH